MEKMHRRIIIIGDKKHDEVQGIAEQLKSKPLIVENEENIPFEIIKKPKKACVVMQSTQNVEKVNKISNVLKQRIKDLKKINTICDTTRAKQKEIKATPIKNDVMIIIGSKTSANTQRLYEISKSLNKRSWRVQSNKDIRKIWFRSAKNVGITAGASTPDYTTKDVIKHIKALVQKWPRRNQMANALCNSANIGLLDIIYRAGRLIYINKESIRFILLRLSEKKEASFL